MKLLLKLSTSSRTEKIEHLRRASSLELKVFMYALNTFYTYGVKYTKHMNIECVEEPTNKVFKLLDDLRSRKISGNKARSIIKEYTKQNGLLLHLILSRRLNCNVGINIVNKAISGYIPTFNVQLSCQVLHDDIVFPVAAQIKYDGVRLVTVIKSGKVSFYTRKGNIVHMPKLSDMFSSHKDVMFDGELIMEQTEGVIRSRKNLSGIVNSANHSDMLDEDRVIYKVFDTLTISEWEANYCKSPERVRHEKLIELFDYIVLNRCEYKIQIVSSMIIQSLHEMRNLFTKILKQGEEGLILKDLNGFYRFKRTKDWFKVKATNTIDLKCVGTIPGKHKITGMIGSLVCEGNTDDGVAINVNVGTGLTQEDRSLDESYYIGKTIEIEYNETIQNSSGSWSLFLPRFIMVRIDK